MSDLTHPQPLIRDEAEDARLIRLAREGSEEATNTLVLRYRNILYLTALQMMGHPDDALDIAQEAMMRFLSTLNRFDTRQPVRPWILRIVRNLVIDLIRKRKRHGERSYDQSESCACIEPVDRTPGPDQQLEATDRRITLWTCVLKLKPRYREILVLRDYQDLSYEEIAKILKIPRGTVMSRLHHARKLLRDLILQGEQHD